MNESWGYFEKTWEELINGKTILVSPPCTNHNLISGDIAMIFGQYLIGKPCIPFTRGEMLFLTENEHYIPDFMVVCDRSKIKPDGVYGAPDLVAEILSPCSGVYDKGHKKRVYESCGVPEYWIVSPEAKSVDVYWLKNGRYELDGFYAVCPDWMLEGMTEDERAAVRTSFKCHMYDDLEIKLDDIFCDLLNLEVSP